MSFVGSAQFGRKEVWPDASGMAPFRERGAQILDDVGADAV